jgi:hypothetical protein
MLFDVERRRSRHACGPYDSVVSCFSFGVARPLFISGRGFNLADLHRIRLSRTGRGFFSGPILTLSAAKVTQNVKRQRVNL